MSHPKDTPRQKFADWVAGVFEVQMAENNWTASEFIDASGLGRNTIYRWMNREDAKDPSIEAVKRFCDRLGLDLAVPAALLGWMRMEGSGIERKLRRARVMAASPHLTDEERAPYAALVEVYEREYRRMNDDLDDLMDRYEQGRGA